MYPAHSVALLPPNYIAFLIPPRISQTLTGQAVKNPTIIPISTSGRRQCGTFDSP
jgi:hypothetical protein